MPSRPPPLAILEIGTTRTLCLVGRMNEEQRVELQGLGVCPTTGIRKGEVTELQFAVSSVRSAVEAAAKAARCDIRTAGVIFSGGNVLSQPSVGRVVIPERQQTVEPYAVDEARELARGGVLPEGRTVLHTVVRNHVLDDTRVVMNPEGLPAKFLTVNMLLVHAATQNLEAMLSVVEEAQIEVSHGVFSALCAGIAVLTAEQKRAGVLLVHLGGGTTTYLAYADETLAAAGSFALGGDHVTNDIQQAFHLTSQKTAEWLKINQGSAVLDQTTAVDRATIPANATLGAAERSFSLRALHTVINARLDEIFKILRGTMEHLGILSKLGAGVVLTGGMAYQRGICTLAQRIFEAPCGLGAMPPLGGVRDDQPAALAAVYGALILAANERAEAGSRRSRGWFPWFRKGASR